MTARSIAFAFVCVIVFAGCLMVSPATDGAPTDTDTDMGQLDQVLEKFRTEGEFGLSLNLDKGGVLRIADTLADAVPPEIVNTIPIIKYLQETDSPNLEKYILSVSPEIKALTMAAEGEVYLFMKSEKVSDGYDYTMRFNGSLKASESMKLDAVDSQHPDKAMGYDAEISVKVDAVAIVHANEDAIPQSVSAKAVISAGGWELMNYKVSERNGEISYAYADAEKDPVDIGYVLEFQGSVSKEVTRADIDAIVSGKSMDRRVNVAFSASEINNGRVAISGIEASYEIDSAVIYSEIRKSFDQEAPSIDSPGASDLSYTDSIYFVLQEFLQNEYNVFFSEQTYHDLIGAGKEIWIQLRGGNLDFFYSFGDNFYNTAIKNSIVGKLDTEMEPRYEFIATTDGDYQLSYWKALNHRCVYVDAKNVVAPEYICGFPVCIDPYGDHKWEYRESDDNNLQVNTYNTDSGEWIFAIKGDMPNRVSISVDGASEGTRSKINVIAEKSIDFDGYWLLRLTVSDSLYELFGHEIHIEYDSKEIVLTIYSEYGDRLFVEDGVVYAYNDWEAVAIEVVNHSLATIKAKITIDGKDYQVHSVIIDEDIEEFVLQTYSNYHFDFVDLQDSKIGKLSIVGPGYVDLRNYTGLNGVQEISISDELKWVHGTVDIPGWSGVGSTFILDDVAYEIFRFYGNDYVDVYDVFGSSIEIPKQVSYGGKTYEIDAINLNNVDLKRLKCSSLWIFLNSCTIDELVLSNTWVSCSDTTVNKVVISSDDAVSIDCDRIAGLNARSIVFDAPISGVWGDVSILSKYGMDVVSLDGIVYLKTIVRGINVMMFVGIIEGDEVDVTIRNVIRYDGIDYPVFGQIDAYENRNIGNVIVESVPSEGMQFTMSSIKSLIFVNTEPLDLSNSYFVSCDKLGSVSFNGPITSIGSNLFEDSTEISSLKFASDIGSIDGNAFASNGYIEQLVFEGSVGQIYQDSFGSFTKLKSVIFKGDVGFVDDDAFSGCSKLESVTFEGNLDNLNMFRECDSLRSIVVKGTVKLVDTAAFHSSDVSSIENLNLSVNHYDRVEYFAFNDLKISKKIIDEVLSRSDYVAPDAFYDVSVLNGEKYETYEGLCSNCSPEKEVTINEYTLYYNSYIESGQVSLNLIGLRYWGSSPDYRIPDSVTIDGVNYPITSIAYHRYSIYHNDVVSLTIGNKIRQIGSLSIFPDLKTVTVETGSLFTVQKFGSGDNSMEMLCSLVDGKKSIICCLGTLNVDEFVIPDGIEYFDLEWINGSTIKKIISGDGVKEINGQLNMIRDLDVIVLGKDVGYINPHWISSTVTVEVSENNSYFISYENSLYRILGDKDLELIHYGGDSSDIPSSFVKNDATYYVTSIGEAAFRWCSLDNIVLSDGIEYLDLSAFSSSNVKNVTVPNGILGISGNIYSKTGNMVFESPDGKTVRTVGGLVYFEKDGIKKVVQYVGGGEDTIFVEDGTVRVILGTIYDDSVKRIVLPTDVDYFFGDYYYSEEGGIDVLAPESIRTNVDRYFHIRPYETSDFYELSISSVIDGISISVTLNHADSYVLMLDGKQLSDNFASWDALFPVVGSEKPETYSPLSVSYVKHEYTVSFETNSANKIPDQKIPYGGYVKPPTVLNGVMEFRGWYTDENLWNQYDFDQEVTTDLKLYAAWSYPICSLDISMCEGAYYIIIGNQYCGDGFKQMEYGQYKFVVVPRQGYSDDPVVRLNGSIVTGDTLVLNKDFMTLTIEGLYKKTNTVHFVNNVSRGTCTADSIKCISGESFDLPSVTPSEGYRFIGWTDGMMLYSGSCTVYDDTSLFAAYVRDPQKMEFFLSEYTVSLSVPDGTTISSSAFFKADKGDTISLPYVAPPHGYVFNGWTLNGNSIGSSYTVLDDVTLVASISKVSTTVPDTPKPDVPKPDTPTPDNPKPEEKVNEDGSITVIDKKDDGSSIETTTKENDDGSTTVKIEEKDKNGNTTDTTTKVTNSDGSSTEVKESKTENGSSIKEEIFDKDGVSIGSTTKVTETVTTDSGITLETEKVTTADGTGEKIAETITVKAESDDGMLKSEATRMEKDGNVESVVKTIIESDVVDGKVELDSTAVSDALKQMDEAAGAIGDADSKVIEIGTKTSYRATHVSIPAESMKEISDAGVDVKITGDVGTIAIGTDVSKNLAEKSSSEEDAKSVSVSISNADRLSMTDKQRRAVEGAKVVKLQASVGDESIHELGGDVTISIPYVLSPGENPDLIRVYYVDDDGGLHMKLSKYDPLTHTVSFVTDHFSYYMIAQEVKVEQTEEEGEESSFPIAVIVVSIAVIVVLAAAMVYRRIH